MVRDPRRAIPAVTVPRLTELGLGDLQQVRPATRRLSFYPHIPLPYMKRVVPALDGLLGERGEPPLVKGLP